MCMCVHACEDKNHEGKGYRIRVGELKGDKPPPPAEIESDVPHEAYF